MIKKLILTAFLASFALSANAQIATPSLDPGFHTYGAAANSWRATSNVSIVGVDVTGKVSHDANTTQSMQESGEVKAGLSAKGVDDSSNLPSLQGAFKLGQSTIELYTSLGDGLKTDVEFDINIPVAVQGIGQQLNVKQYQAETAMLANIAFLFGDSFSVGLGYENGTNKDTTKVSGLVFVTGPGWIDYALSGEATEEIEETTTSNLNVSLSWRLADIFFLAAGMENVSETANKVEVSAAGTSSLDYADNSWTNTVVGVGMLTGDPGGTRFRVEYSMVTSPESMKEETGKATSLHPKTSTSYASVEAQFSNFLLAYQNEASKSEYLSYKNTSNTSLMGIGWQPEEGLTVSLYSITKVVNMKGSSPSEIELDNSGYRFFVGYNF